MWRWSLILGVGVRRKLVFSTYVEVIPYGWESAPACLEYSPRMWRWSPCHTMTMSTQWCILHVCGGDPGILIYDSTNSWYSPRMWRWSYDEKRHPIFLTVFSTYVEVILWKFSKLLRLTCILHVCGGDPKNILLKNNSQKYSPRMWRWSPYVFEAKLKLGVFSTYVEVILKSLWVDFSLRGILHVCGGDPFWVPMSCLWVLYSPRMWRWSWVPAKYTKIILVFSTYVEVILRISSYP